MATQASGNGQVEHRDREGETEQHADAGDEEVRSGDARAEPVAEPSAEQGGDDAGAGDDGAEDEVRGLGFDVALLDEVLRRPEREPADGEGQRRLGEDIGDEGGNLEQPAVIGERGLGCGGGAGALRLLHEPAQGRQQKTGHDDGLEGGPPAEVTLEPPADAVPEGAPDRDRHIEPREDGAAPGDRVEIADDRRRRGSVAGLADAEQAARREQDEEAAGQAGGAAREAPERDAAADDDPAIMPVREPAKDRRREHVADEKRHPEPAGLGVFQRIAVEEFLLDGRDDRREDVAIEVAEEIDGQQQRDGARGFRVGSWGRDWVHLGKRIDNETIRQ